MLTAENAEDAESMKTTRVVAALWSLVNLVLGTSQAADIVVFRDDFNGALSERWAIVRPDASYYSLTDTYLDVRADQGDLWQTRNDAKNVFLINAPTASDFTATMRVLRFVPTAVAYTQIELLAYDDDDNLIRCDYGFYPTGRNVEFGMEASAVWSGQTEAKDFGAEPFWLRVQKAGNTYTQWYSTDGVGFTQANSAITYGDGTPTKLGFTVGIDPTENAHAWIDSFTVSVLDSDGDGMPDYWEEKYFGDPTAAGVWENPDQDGRINIDEYVADTDPTDGTSWFRVTGIRREGNVTLISVPSSEERVYTLQYKSDLLGAPWAGEQSQECVPGVPAWTIVREDSSYYNLSAEYLDLRTNQGDLWEWRTDAKNVFLTDTATTGDFSITMRLIRFVPNNLSWTQIDVLAYDDDDNHVRCGYHFMGTERALQLGVEVAGSWTSQEEPKDFGSDPFWLKLQKVGNTYTQWYSTNGTDFVQGNGEVTFGDGTPTKVGFVAMVDPNEETHALIDYFTVSVLDGGETEKVLFRDDFNGRFSNGPLPLKDTTDERRRFYRVVVDLLCQEPIGGQK